MKPAALDVFACPACRSGLRLESTRTEGEEVLEGTLTCVMCHASYVVTRGVPRFVRKGEYASSFGRQWTWFRTVQLDSANGTHESALAFRSATGWTGDDLAGRRVLDAGVGAGRFAECAAAMGADVYGIDLTTAVDAAYANLRRLPNVHLAQADIFSLPFRDADFDCAYSIGVLHHTPDPGAAFARVAAKVKSGGELAVYVYARYGFAYRSSDFIRRFTTRLPNQVMLALSAIAVPLYPLYRVPGVGKLLRTMLPISMLPNWRWRWLDTFDWYTPTYQFKYLYPEVFRWFEGNGFRDISIFDDPIRMRGVKAPIRNDERNSRSDELGSRHRLVAS